MAASHLLFELGRAPLNGGQHICRGAAVGPPTGRRGAAVRPPRGRRGAAEEPPRGHRGVPLWGARGAPVCSTGTPWRPHGGPWGPIEQNTKNLSKYNEVQNLCWSSQLLSLAAGVGPQNINLLLPWVRRGAAEGLLRGRRGAAVVPPRGRRGAAEGPPWAAEWPPWGRREAAEGPPRGRRGPPGT